MAASNLIALVAAIIGLGVAAQVVADRFQVPSVGFLIAAGIVIGPEGLGFVTTESFGDALPAIVGLSVAIIVFEGAFHLEVHRLQQASTETIRLVTIGALVALVGTTVAAKYALSIPWDVATLIGALLIATGPTVITPIVEVVAVRDRVAAALETEGIVNDVTAAILAIVVFEAVLIERATPSQFAQDFVSRLGVGFLVGATVAAVLWYLLRHVDLSPGSAPQNARLLVLAGALVAFGTAETFFSEAGIAAVATAGILLGNAEIPYKENITEFKGDITLLVLSFVFIALAALLRFEDLTAFGLRGMLVVVAVALIIRPILVFLSTAGGQFTRNEKLFISLVGPRGIIPASVATLFAIELQSRGLDDAATALVGTVFLVILVTVVFEGSLARHFAEALEVIPMRVIIVGGGRVGRELAERLLDRGENVVMIEVDQEQVQRARDAGFTVRHGDGTDSDELRGAGAENAKIVIAATGDDDVNLLIAQLSRSTFDTENVIARVNNPDNVDAFEEVGVRAISSSQATAWAIDNAIERPALSAWMTELGRTGDVQEVEVTADSIVGRTVAELDADLPDGCIIAMVSRDGDNRVPDEEFVLERGDHLTFLGRRDSVREAIEWCRGTSSV